MTVHKSGECFVISSCKVWRPGCYENERTANYAFRFSDGALTELQDNINPGGIITFEMLRGLRNHLNRRIN